jgi:hypothetical protein
MREIATTLVRLDEKILTDFALLSKLGTSFQGMLDSLADLSLAADRRVEDFSEHVLREVCAPLGPLPERVSLDTAVPVKVPAKGASRVRLFSRLRRLLKEVSHQKFNSLSRTHLLNVHLCKALTQSIVHDADFEPLSLAGHADDPPEFEFERRAMKLELDVSRYLVALMALDARVVLGETVDFGSLTNPTSADLSFDPASLPSQERVFAALLEVLEGVRATIALPPELQAELREICHAAPVAPALPGPMTMVGLAPAIQFLSQWFALFPGDPALLLQFAKSLWLWCDLLTASPGGNGLAFLANHIRGRFPALIEDPGGFRAHFRRLSRVLAEATVILELLNAVECSARAPEKYAHLSAGINRVVDALADSPLQDAGPIIATVFRCSYLRLRLYVSVAELQNFAVCCHNLLYLDLPERREGLNSLLASVLHTFPNSPEVRARLRALTHALQA